MTSLGKYRHLMHTATPGGHFVVLAIDHRTNLLDALNKHTAQPLTDAQFVAYKQAIIDALAPFASAVLTDPAYGIGAGVASRAIPGQVGLLAPLEVTDYDLHPSRRAIHYIPDWSVRKIKRCGGDGVKLLLPYHPDADNAADKHAVVRRIVDECGAEDIPFFLEPIAYSLHPARGLATAELRQITLTMARTFSRMGVDVLKLQFPVDPAQESDENAWRAACGAVSQACETVPWALLSAGVDFDTFALQAQTACAAGASGVIVGRAVWNESVSLQGTERHDFIRGACIERIALLANICAQHARPFFTVSAAPHVEPDWYQAY